jgi:TonB family protein
MMLKTKSKRSTWLKALYIVPIVLVSLAMSAKTVTDYEVRTPQKKTVVKKGRKEAQVKMSGTTIEVKTEAEPTAGRPFALHAVVDQYGRITGLSSEGKPDSRQPLEFTIGRIFFDDHVATLEEVKNRKSLGYELYEIIHRPNSAGNPKWNYKDKEGILVFHQKKQVAKDAPKLIFGESNDPEPLFVLNGKVATREKVMALDQSSIDNISVIKNEDTLKEYAKHFNADTSNGIIFVNTKDYVKNGGSKELVSVRVKAKKPQNEEKVFDVVENMPSFPGGTVKMMEYLSTNVRYPEAAHEAGTQGRVVVNFIVEPDGTISNANVVRSVSEELDAEAIRVVENMPKWKPGMQNGKEVRVKYNIPVSFRLN